MLLENKTVIITGASSGIGKAAATLFAANGANVVLGARRESRLAGLSNQISARLLGIEVASLWEQTEFTLVDGLPRPLRYSYRIDGLGDSQENIEFDWAARLAIANDNGKQVEYPLEQTVQDPLSYQAALALLLAQGNQQSAKLLLLEPDGPDSVRYDVAGEELLRTEQGTINTIRLERIREESSSRSTSIWLAPGWNYLLVKIEQQSDTGPDITLTISSASVAGNQVWPEQATLPASL